MQIFSKAAIAAALVATGFIAAPVSAAKAPSDWSMCKASAKKNVADSARVQHCTVVIDAAAKGDKKAAKRLAQAYFHRGVAYNGMDQNDKALADLDQAIKLKPKAARAWYQRGNVHSDLAKFDAAIADYDQAVSLKSKHARAYANRCRARALANKELDKALADCNQSLKLKSKDNGRALAARGLVHLRNGAPEKAIADLDLAVAASPKSAGALYVRGIAKLKKGDKPGGEADLAAAKGLSGEIAKNYAPFGVVP